MADKFELTDDKLKKGGEEIPESEYDNLINQGVSCSYCGGQLSKDEITMHRHVGITETKDMSCQGCWMKAAYGDNLADNVLSDTNDMEKFYIWAKQKCSTDGRGNWQLIKGGVIYNYSTEELYKDWKSGKLP